MEFLTDWGVVIALVCSGAAVLYGVLTSRWLLSLSPGNRSPIARATGGGKALPIWRYLAVFLPVNPQRSDDFHP